jgi:DNA-binding MarR family transcriptional regulator
LTTVQRPDPTLGLLIIAARHAIRHAICVRARKHRLTTQQFWAIFPLRQAPGLTPGELGHRMLLDAPAASRLVADLSKRKLLEVKPDREDRRRTRLFLSEKGIPLADKLQLVADEYQQAITRGMTDDEVRVIRAGLAKVVENLAGFGGEPDSAAPKPDRVARTGA